MPELRSRLVAWFRIGMCCAASPYLCEAASLDLYVCGPVAQWIRRRPTEPETAGSSPTGVIYVITSIRDHGDGDGPYPHAHDRFMVALSLK